MVIVASMATNAEVGNDVTLYGTVVIPAFIEKHASDVLNFSKPRYIEVVVYRPVTCIMPSNGRGKICWGGAVCRWGLTKVLIRCCIEARH